MVNKTDIVEVERVANPFANEKINIGTTTVESERAIAEVKAAMAMAKASPRNKYAAMERILDACSRHDFAKTALFAYPRGGEQIEGPSIRLAEMIARCWGNIEYGIKELSQDEGMSEMMAYAWDLETNVRSIQTFKVKHERRTRGGVTKLDDQRDIYEIGANLGARRLRARILAVIDSDVVEAAVKQVKASLAAELAGTNKKTLAERLNKLVSEFGKLGVKVSHIEARLGKQLKDILPEEYSELCSIYNSIKDGGYKPSEYFNIPSAVSDEKAQEIQSALIDSK